VTEELRARVQEAVRALDYRPNGTARALRTRRSQLVALIIPDVANHFYAQLARGVHDAIKPHGFHVTLGNTDAEAAEELYFLREVARQHAAGAIAIPFRLSADQVRDACGRAMPLVVIAPIEPDSGVASIEHDDLGGVAQAVRYLIAQGRRRIVFINGLLDTPPSRRRHAGYLRAHEEAGLTPDPLLQAQGDFKLEGGEHAMRRILESGAPFDAVSAANDLMAIGAIRALRARKIRIPEDVAVVGYDDIEEAQIVEPALTTVRQPAYETGHAAATLLLKHIEGEPQTTTHLVLSTTLVIRRSA
jgi:DNA-binding LacI/PurR family transcriptional regulator